MFHKLLGEASDDLERVTPQSHESFHAETTRNKHQCSRPETLSEKPCSRSETPSGKSVVPIPQSPPNRSEACAVKLEQVVDGDFRKQLELRASVRTWRMEIRIQDDVVLYDNILNLLFTEAERKGKTRHFRMYVGPGSDGSSADKLSLDLKFNPGVR